MDDLSEIITKRVSNQQNTIILGDFNIHMDNLEDNDAIEFSNTMDTSGIRTTYIWTHTQVRKYIGPNT